jgi:acetyltransferase
MKIINEYARWLVYKSIEGQVLRENTTMLRMCRELGFAITPDPDDRDVAVVKLTLEGAGSLGHPI